MADESTQTSTPSGTQASTTAAPAAPENTGAASAVSTTAEGAATGASAGPSTTAPAGASAESGPFGEIVTYQPSGDSNLDLALGFLGRQGLGPEHPAVAAATKGDFNPLRAILAEKGIQGAEAYIAIGEQAYQAFQAKEAAKTQATQQVCVQAAGSAEEWQSVLDWASANAEPAEKEALNGLLGQGGIAAEAAAFYLVNQYRGSNTVSAPPQAAVVKPTAPATQTTTSGPLSPTEYAQAVHELRRTKGVGFESSPEYAQLQRRRAAYRG